jgi:hypothetical protein
MFLYADCNVTETIIWPVILIFNCFKHRNEKNIYLITYTQWTIEDKCCNKISLKRYLRKLTLFRYVTGRYVRSSVIEKYLLMKSSLQSSSDHLAEHHQYTWEWDQRLKPLYFVFVFDKFVYKLRLIVE